MKLKEYGARSSGCKTPFLCLITNIAALTLSIYGKSSKSCHQTVFDLQIAKDDLNYKHRARISHSI
jgi:hypothetical protein